MVQITMFVVIVVVVVGVGVGVGGVGGGGGYFVTHRAASFSIKAQNL
jgi:hypothetical protein